MQGHRHKNFQGGGHWIKDQKIAKKTENSTIKPFPEEGARGNRKKTENGKKRPKNSKKKKTLFCTMYENPGGAVAKSQLRQEERREAV